MKARAAKQALAVTAVFAAGSGATAQISAPVEHVSQQGLMGYEYEALLYQLFGSYPRLLPHCNRQCRWLSHN